MTQRALVLLAVLVSVPGAARAQVAQTPSFRAGVEALPVDVTVVDAKGQPIRDLIAADFTVRVDGRARRAPSAQWSAAPSGDAAVAIDRGDEATLMQVAARDCPGRTQRERQPCIDEIRAEAQSIASETRQSGDFTLNSLREVLTSIKAVEGPKTVLFVSQGFFSDRERGDDTGRINELGSLASAARARI